MKQKSLKIYYCDDDPDDQLLFMESVRESGSHDITLFDSGFDLLTVLENHSLPDLIFLDLNMPRMNGTEVLKKITEMEHCHDIPVLVFTTSGNRDTIELTRNLGARLFITKPDRFELLSKMVKHCLAIDWKLFKPSRIGYEYKAA